MMTRYKTHLLIFSSLFLWVSPLWAAVPVDHRSVKPGDAVTIRGEKFGLYPGNLKIGDSFLHDIKGTDIDFPFRDRVTIVSLVPSIDTKVCELQTHRLGKIRTLSPKVDVVTISRDLPFAQERFAREAKLKNIKFVSDYKTGSFGKTTGLMVEGKELLTRGILVLDKEGVVRYIQLVPELSHLPDIAEAVRVANGLVRAK